MPPPIFAFWKRVLFKVELQAAWKAAGREHTDTCSHLLWLLHHRHRGPCKQWPYPSCCTQTPIRTHMHTEQGAPHPGEELEMELNEKTGQTVLVRHRAWPEKCTDQPTIYTRLALFIPFPLCFKTINPTSCICQASSFST